MQTESYFDIDLRHQGYSGVIAACALETHGHLAIVDPGPSSTIDSLIAGLKSHGFSIHDVEIILLTHVHLDHAGCTGILLKQNPRIQIYVHERGRKHLIDPSRLWESAQLIFEGEAEHIWGRVYPVPSAAIQVLADEQELSFYDRTLRVLYTPGHASHHLAYLDLSSRILFVGDAVGVRLDSGISIPAAPPPDIDLELWNTSLDRMAAEYFSGMFMTHFGLHKNCAELIETMRNRLQKWASVVRESLGPCGSDVQRAAEFSREIEAELGRSLSPIEVRRHCHIAGPVLSWHGLARYWRKRLGPAAPETAKFPLANGRTSLIT